MSKKESKSNILLDKGSSIIDFISYITYNKKHYSNLSEKDKKTFQPYIINRWLSMNPDYIELVNELQKYTITILEKKDVYNLYHDILPKLKSYNKYIKGTHSNKYNTDLISLLTSYYSCSEKHAIEMLNIISKDELIKFIQKFGKTEKEINNLIQIK